LPSRKQTEERALETQTVCRVAQLSPKTLDYWIRTGLVRPSVRATPGRRVPRLWSIDDAIVVRTIKALRDAGCPLQRIRAVKRLLASQEARLGGATLFWDGTDVLLMKQWGEVESAVRRPGQQVLHVLAIPLSPWREELGSEATVVPMRARRQRHSALPSDESSSRRRRARPA
jgi:DNA-binding transcriptional MerR regulator